MALATDQRKFHAISQLIDGWQEEERDCLDRLERLMSAPRESAVAINTLAELRRDRKNLSQADRVKLAHALRVLVEKVTFHKEYVGSDAQRYRVVTAEIHWSPATFERDNHVILATRGGKVMRWLEILGSIKAAQRPLRTYEIATITGLEFMSVREHAKRLVAAGFIEEIAGKYRTFQVSSLGYEMLRRYQG